MPLNQKHPFFHNKLSYKTSIHKLKVTKSLDVWELGLSLRSTNFLTISSKAMVRAKSNSTKFPG